MRHQRLALFTVLLAGVGALAQQEVPPAAEGQDPVLAVLQRWEKELGAVQSLTAQVERTDVNKTFRFTEVYMGTAKYLKLEIGGRVQNLASLEMTKKDTPQVYQKFICTGELLYQFVPQEKEIRVHQLPPPKQGQVADDNFLSFLFGMKAEEARRRFEITLQNTNDPTAQFYYYISIKPRFPEDRDDFQQARLVLLRETFLPRQLWFEEPNGNHVTWDIKKSQVGTQMDRREFTAPETPVGWKVVRVPPRNQEAKPRIIRPQQ
jgi:TIGR03009 family protein